MKKGHFHRFPINVKALWRLVFFHWSHLFTNTFTTMHVKIRRNMRWRVPIVDSLTDHFTWQMLSYSHMHLVQMFQLKVHTSSMTGSLPRGIPTNIIPGTCMELHDAGQTGSAKITTEKHNVCFLKIYTIKSTQYINLQCLPIGRALVEVKSG